MLAGYCLDLLQLSSEWVLNTHPLRELRNPEVEAKNPALLSSRDGYLLELTGWTKGSQAS